MEYPDHIAVDESQLEYGQMVLFELQHRYNRIREVVSGTVYEPRAFWFHVWELSRMSEDIPQVPGRSYEENMAAWMAGQPTWQRRWYRREAGVYCGTHHQMIGGKRVHLCKLMYVGEQPIPDTQCHPEASSPL